jgi:hypothetical protein
MYVRLLPFTRPTTIAAVELLELHTQASFDQLMLRLQVERDTGLGTALSVAKKCVLLGGIVVQRPTTVIDTIEGAMTLAEAVVRAAIEIAIDHPDHLRSVTLMRGLARDGFTVSTDTYGQRPKLRASLPQDVSLPETDDEVHILLRGFHFVQTLSHLDQAIQAHMRGDWAATNAQLRTFIESLLDQIAIQVRPNEAASLTNSENRRSLLASIKFLDIDQKEWSDDGKNFINGTFKMLHTEGSHPGVSDEDHSTFRLHLVLITARMLLRRLARGSL